MAKKIEPAKGPEVSNLPIPMPENPLVIDLPDGQKLVVGKLESGTVIEVATWRGTGRPDSRTNRLMLGMSAAVKDDANQQSNSITQPELVGNESVNDDRHKNRIKIPIVGEIKFPKFDSKKVKNINIKSLSNSSKQIKNKLLAKSKELAPVESVAELDIDAWLANIKKDSEAKVLRKIAQAKTAKSKSGVKTSKSSVKSPKKPKKRS